MWELWPSQINTAVVSGWMFCIKFLVKQLLKVSATIQPFLITAYGILRYSSPTGTIQESYTFLPLNHLG
jgi:hypothetical protein